MSSLGLLMGEKIQLEQRLHDVNNLIKDQELEKYSYLKGKCFKIDNMRYKILDLVDINYHDQYKIEITYQCLKIGNKTITTGLEKHLLIVIEHNIIQNDEFNNKFNDMVNYIKTNILGV